jgi:hypothetical protein
MAKRRKRKKPALVEIARSFSFKLNCGNYESRDFFCSEKAEVPEDEAEIKSEQLYQFCKGQVLKSVEEYQKSLANVPIVSVPAMKPFEKAALKSEAEQNMPHEPEKVESNHEIIN